MARLVVLLLGLALAGEAAAQQPRDLRVLAREAALRHGLDPALVLAVIRVESGFDPLARSPKGAMGLMQLMPATARRFGVADPWDPAENLEGGCAYLAWLLDRYDGDRHLALAAYNAGEAAVDEHDGIPPYAETRAYVARITGIRVPGPAGRSGGRARTGDGRVVEWHEGDSRKPLFDRPHWPGGGMGW